MYGCDDAPKRGCFVSGGENRAGRAGHLRPQYSSPVWLPERAAFATFTLHAPTKLFNRFAPLSPLSIGATKLDCKSNICPSKSVIIASVVVFPTAFPHRLPGFYTASVVTCGL